MTLVYQKTASRSPLNVLSKMVSSLQLLEGRRGVLKLSSRHLEQLTAVYILETVNDASRDVGSRSVNRSLSPIHDNKLLILEPKTRRGALAKRKRKGYQSWTRKRKEKSKKETKRKTKHSGRRGKVAKKETDEKKKPGSRPSRP